MRGGHREKATGKTLSMESSTNITAAAAGGGGGAGRDGGAGAGGAKAGGAAAGGSGSSGGGATACAACKFQRRRCSPECVLAPYFPVENTACFMSCKRLFGVSNMVRILTEGVQPAQKDDTIKSLILEADARQRDPVYGSAGIITTLREEVAKLQEELVVAKEQLSFLVSQLHQQHQEHHQQHQQQHQQQEQQFFVFDPPQQQQPHVVHQPQMHVVPHHPHSQLLGDHGPPLNVMDSSLAPPEQPPLLLFQPGFLPMDFVQHQAEEAPQVKQERLDPEEQQLEQEFGGNFFQPANGEHREQQEQQEHQQRHH